MQTTQIRDFTKGNIAKQLVVFSMPLFLSNLLQVVYNMVDMIIIGNHLGKTALSAVAIGGDVTHFLTFLAIGFSNAGQVLIAQLIGAKRQKEIGDFVGTMSGFLMLCAVIIGVAGLSLRHAMLTVMNTPAEAYEGALSYSSICMIGLVFIYGYNIVSAILRGMGDSKHPFIFISIAAVLNLVLDILFVMVLDMGPGGAALATVVSQAVSFIACTVFLVIRRKEFQLSISFMHFVRWRKNMLGSLVKLGVPMAILSASVQVSKLFVNSWINSYGLAVSAFAGIANKIANISYLVANALNTAGSTMVGQNIAAREFGRVKKVMLEVGKISITLAVLISVLICVFPLQIFGIFTSDTAVLELVNGYIPIAVLLFFGSALRAIMNAFINGSGNTQVNFFTAILDSFVLRIGLALLFGLALNMKHYGFWLGDALAGFTPFWIGLIFYFSGRWKKGKEHVEAE
ncbi:MAG: MATE family efflux transporter [Clostridiales bacterium]|nr:MATE family efflux transporter [Clostridiales bacterium]